MTRMQVWNESMKNKSPDEIRRPASEHTLDLLLKRISRAQKIKQIEYTEEQKALLAKVEQIIQGGVSQAELCRLTGVPEQVMSPLRKGTYTGKLEKYFGMLENYFEVKEAAGKNYKPVKYAPISTSNLAYQTIRNIQIMGGFGIVVGDPSIGKTKAVMKYAEDNLTSCIAITAGVCISTKRAVLKEMALKLNIPIKQAVDDLYRCIIAKLHDGMLIVVDEAQHLTYDAIESLREISDYFDAIDQTCGVVLVGNNGIVERMEGAKTKGNYPQTNNRRWQLQELKTTDISMPDIKMIFPLLDGQDKELSFLLAISNSALGLRGAVKIFSQAYISQNYDFKGLVSTAKTIGARIEGAERALKAVRA